MKHVLLVDCDPQALTARGDELAADAFEPILAASAPAARAMLRGAEAMILGRLDSAPATLGVLSDLRAGSIAAADPALPVVTVGADRDHELVRHYQAGSDIALPSDASPLLLTASLHALVARHERQHSQGQVRVGNLTIGLRTGVAKVGDRPLQLTNREFQVLSALARDPAAVVTKTELLKDVWEGYSHGRAPDAIVHRLRERLQADGATVTVRTHRGRGWQLSATAPPDPIAAAFPHPATSRAPRQASPTLPQPTPARAARARTR